MQIQSNNDLLSYLISQANSGTKNWFGFQQQKIAGIDAVYKIAANHANTMTPEEITEYVAKLNNCIYDKFIKM